MILSPLGLTLIGILVLQNQNDLQAGQRSRIDKIALAQESETKSQEAVNLAGNLTALLANQRSLTAQQEADLATGAHTKLLGQVRLLPTPEGLQKVWDRLVAALPAVLKPEGFTFQVYLVDKEESGCLTLGGGRVYMTRGSLERLQKSDGALAFVLSHQLGHICRQDCRRGWQIYQLPPELKRVLQDKEEKEASANEGDATVNDTGRLSYLLYSRQQCYLADLFAWQLCRKARFDLDQALDAVRIVALEQYPALKNPDDALLDGPGRRSVINYYLSDEPDPLLRLQRLLKERDGVPDQPDKMGLFHYNASTAGFQRPAPGLITADVAPIVLVHGLRGDHTTFKDFLAFLAARDELKQRPLLIFRYPENDSLARSGIFLDRELTRMGVNRDKTDFICHSAGGLVFRYYAEKRRGAFQRAYFLGTPQHGSELIKLKFLIDLTDFARMLSVGLPTAIARSVPSWRSAIAVDLHPDSLFLHDLGDNPMEAGRYEIYYGQYLNKYAGIALQLAVPAVRELLKQQIESRWGALKAKEQLFNALDCLEVPNEVVQGDGMVSLASANLPGVKRSLQFALDHLQIKQNEAVMKEVLISLLAK